MKKKVLLIFMAALLLWTGMACASDEDLQGDLPQLELTLEELAAYDGKDGNPAYIAVSFWRGGEHNGFSAGQDLTDAIKNQSPHGVARLRGVPVVGELVE